MRSGRPRGPGNAFKNVGGFAPHIFVGHPGPPGAGQTSKTHPNKSGQTAFRYTFEFLFVSASEIEAENYMFYGALCYALVFPGRKSAFRAGFWPDCYRASTEIGPPAGLRPAGGPISVLSR